jgi:hypothetical protein
MVVSWRLAHEAVNDTTGIGAFCFLIFYFFFRTIGNIDDELFYESFC